MEIHMTEPEVPETNAFEEDIATVKVEKYIPPGTDLILDEVTQARGKTMCSEIYNLVILF
jgi:hypothetical protein